MSKFITAKIVLDSISESNGQRLITYELEYHRYIHSEFLTHRVFSRSSSSSRAIPVKKFLDRVADDPVMPIEFGTNQRGMQAGKPLSGSDLVLAENDWQLAAKAAAHYAERMMNRGVHKQVANRLLEPFLTIKTLLTATDYDNWYKLRNHSDAMPEIRYLAQEMLSAVKDSEPVRIEDGGWHLPYITAEDLSKVTDHEKSLKLMSAARCARVSYLNHDGTQSTFKEDWDLCSKLAGSQPIHASPFEHVATPGLQRRYYKNFNGWRQMREEIENAK